MVKGFKKGGKFRPTGKNRKSKKKKTVTVEIVSVTLRPDTINKIKNRQVKLIKKKATNPSFSKALNQLVDQA